VYLTLKLVQVLGTLRLNGLLFLFECWEFPKMLGQRRKTLDGKTENMVYKVDAFGLDQKTLYL